MQPAGGPSSGDSLAQRGTASAPLPVLEGYDIVEEIGRGGMGVVYEAYQRATGRRVALKFMVAATGLSEAARRRFEREVELAARLQHPHIVPVLDSGILQGRYYYAMDYVEGRPLDTVLAPGQCDVRAALVLLATVAEAVDYAHQRGVLHRDLKPANILIDAQGQPHLLDFGLAKAIDPVSVGGPALTLSEPGQLLGTLGYMSPEQSRGQLEQLSVRSDVYSLGAIGFELITGVLPCGVEGALGDVLARIAQQDPPRPSGVRRGINPDVDAILLKALEKSPQARYATASELAADIRRFLDHRAVMARQVGWMGRMARWARRNRRVASVGGAAILLILALTVAALLRIEGERDRARTQATKAQRINAFLMNLLASVDPFTARGPEVTVRELLDEAARRLEADLQSEPEIQAALRYTVAGSYHNLGLYRTAEPLLRATLETRRRLLGSEHLDVAETLVGLGLSLDQQGQYAEAEQHVREALRIRHKRLGQRAGPVAEALNKLGQVLRHEGDAAAAEQAFRQALAIRRELSSDENQVDVAFTLYHLGLALLDEHMFRDADQAASEALELYRQHVGTGHALYAAALALRGRALRGQGDLAAAEALLREAVARMRDRVGPEHPRLAMVLADLAELLLEEGDRVGAEPLAREALLIRQKRLPADHPDVKASEATLRRALEAGHETVEEGPMPATTSASRPGPVQP